jgi:hypothetical protein
MKQLAQLTIDQYNEYMRRGEVMLPETVTENTPVRDIKAGTWFVSGGITYLKTELKEIGVTLDGCSKFFFDYSKGKLITQVEAGLTVAYYRS